MLYSRRVNLSSIWLQLTVQHKHAGINSAVMTPSPSLSPPAGGLMLPWRRRWCVLKDETFMWFRAKQESLKSGWLYKKGGGLYTLSRRNWKMRWFVLRGAKLMYFENDSEERLKGTIDIRSAK